MQNNLQFQDLIARQIKQESGGNPNAVSPAGAAGLMQIMPDTASDPGFGVAPMAWDQRFNEGVNRDFGTEYMRAMLNRYGNDQARALVAYNWGPGNADKWDGNVDSLPGETQGYLRNILGGSGSTSQQDPESKNAIAQQTPEPEEQNRLAWDTHQTDPRAFQTQNNRLALMGLDASSNPYTRALK